MTIVEIIPLVVSLTTAVVAVGGLFYTAKRFKREVNKEVKEEIREDVESNSDMKMVRHHLEITQQDHEKLLFEIPKIKERMASWETSIEDIKGIKHDLDILCGRFDMFWEMITPVLQKALHAPIHLERDTLMLKLKDRKLSGEEVNFLMSLVEKDMTVAEKSKDWVQYLFLTMTLARIKDMKITSSVRG